MQVRAEERKTKKRLIPYRLLSCILSSPKQLHAGPKFVYVSIVDRLSKWHWLFLSLYLWLLQLNYQLFLFRSRVYFSTPWIWDLLWKWDEAEVIGCQFCAWASRVPGQFVLLSPTIDIRRSPGQPTEGWETNSVKKNWVSLTNWQSTWQPTSDIQASLTKISKLSPY